MMDRNEMLSLDLRFIARDLRSALKGGKVRKIYQYPGKRFMMEFFVPGAGGVSLYFDSSKAFLTEHKLPSTEPPTFCMFLRKHLMGREVRGIEQLGFDRILEIRFSESFLIIEMVPPGNVILTDQQRHIIMPLEIQRWKTREVKSRVDYRSPPLQQGPFGLGMDELMHRLRRADKSIGAFLATDMGLGRVYSDEVCLRAGVDKSRPAADSGLETVSRLHKALEEMDKPAAPTTYEDFVSPFPLKGREAGKAAESFSQALDGFFIQSLQEEKPADVQREKVERIIEQQEKKVEELAVSRVEKKSAADIIYSNYSTVQAVLEGIMKARGQGMSWEELKEKIVGEDSPEAQAVKEIKEHEGVVVVELEGSEVELDFRLSVEENAARLYEGGKADKAKLERVELALKEKREELENPPPAREEQEIKKKLRKKWYEKFKWFLTSDGLLAVGGKDAKQNEMIFSKHCNPGDFVFHADIPGAALVIIQGEGRDISEEAKKEAAEFAAAHSKAWSKGLGAVDVYGVSPEQVSKSPPSGQALARGSFMISGERQWFNNVEVKLAVGVSMDRENEEAKVLTGPVFAMRKHASYFITIRPGFKKSLELARSIKNKLLIRSSPEDKPWIERLPLDEIQRVIPSGMGEIVEYG